MDFELKREDLGLIIVSMDLACVLSFLLYLWFITYFVKIDVERHRKQLLETKQFALCFSNLPKLTENYSLEMLRADLWDHIESIIR